MVTYTLNKTAVARTSYEGASDSAKLMAEIFERLAELDEIKYDAGANLVRRLATLADLSPAGYRIVIAVGGGNTEALVGSYEDQSDGRGLTRQAIHWQWQDVCRRIGFVFPELVATLQHYRETVHHHEGAISAADGLRLATNRDDEPAAKGGA